MTPNKVGATLKAARELRNLSQRQVEEATGISNAYVSQLESGKIKKPSPIFLHKLAALYDLPYESLLEESGYLPKPGRFSTMRPSPSKALLDSLKLTAEEESKLLEFMKFLRRDA